MVVKVTETGRIEPKTTVEVKSKVGGEIVLLRVKEGDWVRKGELLVELDTTDLIRLRQTLRQQRQNFPPSWPERGPKR